MKISKKIGSFYKNNWKEISSGIVSIAAILITVMQYLSLRENEFRKSLFNEQFEIYEELLERTSIICYFNKDSVNKQAFEEALLNYEKFQKGRLMLVNDTTIKNRVQSFLNRAKTYFSTNLEKTILQSDLESLCNCCRKSLQETFRVDL